MTRRDVVFFLTIAILAIVGVVIVRSTSQRSDNSESKPTDSMRTPEPVPAAPLDKAQIKALSLDDIPLGISQASTKKVLDETNYSVNTDPFGQVNREIACYTISPFQFCGIDGELKIVFDEPTNLSTGAIWGSFGSVTRSDFKNIVKRISGHAYKGSEYESYAPELWYSWKNNKKSFTLRWSERQTMTVLVNEKQSAKNEVKEPLEEEQSIDSKETTE